jgi:hypothetical protein
MTRYLPRPAEHRASISTREVSVLLLCSLALIASCRADPDPRTLEQAAHFRVTTEVVNPAVGAFTTSNAGIGNSLVGSAGGFEPVIVRDAFVADADAVDDIHAGFVALTHWDSFAEPLLDDAEVEVWRVEQGQLRKVRSDLVAHDGAHLSGWIAMTPDKQLIPADARQYSYRWDDWNRPDGRYWFSLRSVDRAGHESPEGPWVEARSPHDTRRAAALPANQLQTFQPGVALPFAAAAVVSALRGEVSGDGLLHLSWDSPGADAVAGYRLYRSDYPPPEHRGYFLHLAGHAASPGEQIRKGDWVMWKKKLYSVKPTDFSQRLWSSQEGYARYLPGMLDFPSDDKPGRQWALVPHAADSPVPDGGETCLRLTLAAGEEARLQIPNHAGTQQRWYDVLQERPYQYSLWLRQDGDGSARFRFTGPFDQQGKRILPQDLRVGHEWRLQFGQFTPPETLTAADPGFMALELRGPATFYLDNFEVHRADAPFLSWLPEDREALKASGMTALRTHAFIKSQNLGYDLDQYTNAGGAIASVQKRNSLPQTLAAMRTAGVDPWLQIEMYFRPEDWRNLVEYLAAPFDPALDTRASRPWAWKRFHQGHPAPWTDDFRQIYVEVGNETWNRIFVPWVFTGLQDAAAGRALSSGTVYGLYQEAMIGAMKRSPWWKVQNLDQKFRFVLGGWTTNLAYGADAVRASPSSDFLTIAGYNGGWDWGKGPRPDTLESYFEILNDVSQSAVPVADQFASELTRLNIGRRHPVQLGTYEAGPGYALNGLNGAHVSPAEDEAEDRVMKSFAAGTATLDAFLARAYRGFTLQNFFGFSRGGKWGSHARWFDGGQAWPSWKLLALFNQQGTGSMLRTETLAAPSWRLADAVVRKSSPEVPLIASYALRRGDRFMLFLLSRKTPGYPAAESSGFTPVSADLPFRHYRTAKVFQMTGTFKDNNLKADRVRINETELGPALLDGQTLRVGTDSGADPRGIAPGATLLYVFEGTDLGTASR